MVNFSFASAHALLEKLSILIECSYENMRSVDYDADSQKATIYQSKLMVRCCVETSGKLCVELRSNHIDGAVESLHRFLYNTFEWSELNTRARAY